MRWQTITLLSPYFDEYGESLITLSQLCPNSTVNVLIHQDCALPPSECFQIAVFIFMISAKQKGVK